MLRSPQQASGAFRSYLLTKVIAIIPNTPAARAVQHLRAENPLGDTLDEGATARADAFR
jgi:hypothetical protein